MRKLRHLGKVLLVLGFLPALLSSCATPPPPRTFHNTDNSSLVIKTSGDQSAQIVAPQVMDKAPGCQVLDQLRSLGRHKVAVVILEDYSEPQLGPQFRDRSLTWFMGLRNLGYEHIVFVQGKGVQTPEGLPVLAEYE